MTPELERAAGRAPRHSVQRLVGNPGLIDSKIRQNLQVGRDGRPWHCAGNVTAKDAKYTK